MSPVWKTGPSGVGEGSCRLPTKQDGERYAENGDAEKRYPAFGILRPFPAAGLSGQSAVSFPYPLQKPVGPSGRIVFRQNNDPVTEFAVCFVHNAEGADSHREILPPFGIFRVDGFPGRQEKNGWHIPAGKRFVPAVFVQIQPDQPGVGECVGNAAIEKKQASLLTVSVEIGDGAFQHDCCVATAVFPGQSVTLCGYLFADDFPRRFGDAGIAAASQFV